LTYTTAVVRLTAAIPFASVATGALGRTLAVVYYGVLFGAWGVRKLEAGGWKLEAGSWQARLVRRGVGWAAMAIVPLWLGLTALGALPDGRLHLFFVPGEDGEAALIVTPTGRAVWIWDGRGDAATLARATTPLLTGWRKEVDVVLAPSVAADRPPAAQGLDPTQLAPNAEVRLDDAVTLTRLAAGKDWALLLRHGDFSALLPSTLKQEAQIALLAENSDDVLRVTLLKGAGPGAGAWPPTALLAATAAQVILWPQDTTYPPDVVESLTSRGALRVAPDAVLEIVSDGKQMWLRQRSGPGSPLAP
jgi:hypothetical protein